MTRTAVKKSNIRRGRPRFEKQRVLYQIKLSGWDFTWSLSLALPNNLGANEGHYHEHMILTLKGEVLYPENFKYPEAECQLYADPRLMQDIAPPKGIGSMAASGTRLVAYVAVPRERINALVGAADRLLSLELNATPLHYRRALVMSIHLGTEPEPDW
ncbi:MULTISPECIES: hypothetical protein [Pseudomonas]|uniref:Uncharacterized protein n=2 Tax=Pseudomonas syringae group genomosp. 2 TaxID=251698 RepID=A0AAX1VQY4_PSEAJ|nr:MULTISPECIES: hypothetical protein [Pseudomonas]KEZ25865.1 hypothetical protein A3SK_0119245 [Pseudomonas amygdali pv. tabaci str. 6605]MBP1138532.1 hypothetical protein [Pseudomonas sp. PvP009]RML78300.1 hypothetical protein ALQ89_03668 [Pseudomonas amygdali pv. tabaci]BCS42451.1 hypothetical protein Pta6605_07820 [Pseudomonas amygdali pv. tabaci]